MVLAETAVIHLIRCHLNVCADWISSRLMKLSFLIHKRWFEVSLRERERENMLLSLSFLPSFSLFHVFHAFASITLGLMFIIIKSNTVFNGGSSVFSLKWIHNCFLNNIMIQMLNVSDEISFKVYIFLDLLAYKRTSGFES